MELIAVVLGIVAFIVTVIVVPLRLAKLSKKIDIVTKNQTIIEKKIIEKQ